MGLHLHAQPLPRELDRFVPGAALSGQSRMTFWGFEVYQVTLWVAPGFLDAAYAQSAFGLELLYLRDFKGADIAKRSIVEMRRQGPLTAEQEVSWEGQMRALFPDVKNGDRITGVNQPGTGATFWSNGRLLGDVRDPGFAQKFFGIWLSPQTSEPTLRRALLAQAKTHAPLATPTSPASAP
jgi:hypothetical protein